MFSEHHAAQMITIDEHRVCYDGDIHPHAHFYCHECGRVYDLKIESIPLVSQSDMFEGHHVNEVQVYYKGICGECYKLNPIINN